MVLYKKDGKVVARLRETYYGYGLDLGCMKDDGFAPSITFHLQTEQELSYAERALGKTEQVIYKETPCP